MALRVRRLVRLLFGAPAPGALHHPGIVLGGVLLGSAIPAWALPQAEPPAADLVREVDPLCAAQRPCAPHEAAQSLGPRSHTPLISAAATPDPFDRQRSTSPLLLAAVEEPTRSDVQSADAPAAPTSTPEPGFDAVITEAADLELAPEGAEPATPAPSAPTEKKKAHRWAIAPIRWGGTLSTGYRRNWTDTSTSSQQNLDLRVRGNSYLVAPYISRISGDVGLGLVRSQSETDGSPAGANLRGTSITGSVSLDLFPVSRFPFRASLSRSDSRTDGTLTNSDYTRQRFSLRQEYRPQVGSWRSYGAYDRSELSGNFGDDTVDRFSGGLSFSHKAHIVSADGSYSRAERTDGVLAKELVGTARHTFRPTDTWSIDSTATYTGSERVEINQMSSDIRALQAFSFGSWAPADSPWRATGSVRYFQTESQFGDSSTTIDSLGGSGSLSYEVNPNLRLYGSADINTTAVGDQRLTASSQTGGLSYSADPLTFGNYSYNWYGSASLTNSMAGDTDQQTATGTLGHSLNRNWILTDTTGISASLAQSVASTRINGTTSLSTNNLSHTANVALRTTPSDAVSGYMAFSFSDSRSFSDTQSSFQLFNVQMSGNWRVSAQASFNANLTWQKTRQSSEIIIDPEFGTISTSSSDNGSISGSLGFNHGRLFGVRNLHYTLRYAASTYATDNRLAGDPDAGREQITHDLDQRLYYRIGRLRAEVTLRQAIVDGKENALLFFKVSRDFGAF